MVASPLQWHLLRSEPELLAIEDQWRALCLADPRSTPFQRPEWLLPWWHQFAPASDALRVLRLHNGTQTLALLPLYLYREPTSGERQLQLLGVGTTDYLDLILDPACPRAALPEGLKLLLATDDWDTLHLNQLRPDSPLLPVFSALPGHERYASESCSRMPATPLAQLPTKIRRNAMYYRNSAERRGKLSWQLATHETLPSIYDSLVALHTSRWQEAGEPGVLADPLVLAWHREAFPRLLEAGLLRLGWLCLDSSPIGVLLSFIDPPTHPSRTQYLYLTAFDPGARALRPGTLLLALAIDHAAAEGVEVIDMLRGQESYKALWHVESVPTVGFVLPRTALASIPHP